MGRTFKSKIKRFASLLLAVVTLISVVPTTLANPADKFGDFPTGWSRPAMEAAVNNGLLVGIGGGQIGPQKYLTRAEMAAIVVRAFGATTVADVSVFKDLDPDKWYYDYVASAVRMGALAGVSETAMAPEANITREQVFSVLARILALKGNNVDALSKFKDKDSISGWALETVIPMVERGYVMGDNLGKMNPKAYITREEFAQVMYQAIKTYITEPGTYEGAMEGIVVLRTGNVTLKGVTVNGDLVLGDGVALNTVNIEGTTVNGRLLTRGGIITLKNTTVASGVVVLNPNGTTYFRNFKTEAPFAGIIEYTVASFLTLGGSGSSGGGSSKKYTVTFKLFEDDEDPYREIKVLVGRRIGSNMPADPTVENYTFNGWLDEDGDPVTSDTAVYRDMTVVADLTPVAVPTITVTFYEGFGDRAPQIGTPVTLILDNGVASVESDDIPEINKFWNGNGFKKSDYMPASYPIENDEYKVVPSFWYQENEEWKPFDETVVLSQSTKVHLFYKEVSFAALGASISARYDDNARFMDTLKVLAHQSVIALQTAKDSNVEAYDNFTTKILNIFESKNLIDDEKHIKTFIFPLALSNALKESTVKEVIEDRVFKLMDNIADAGNVDTFLAWPGVEGHLVSEGVDTNNAAAVIAYASVLTNRNAVYNAIYATDEYKNVIKAIKNNSDFDVIPENLEILKGIREELQIITFSTVMGMAGGSAITKLVDVLGYDVCADIFDGGREVYCDELAGLIDAVENGGPNKTIPSAFMLSFDPVGDIIKPIYERVMAKVVTDLEGMNVHYDENLYLQYLAEDYNIIDELFDRDPSAQTEDRSAYKLKDGPGYAESIVRLLIAMDDALCYYSDLSDIEFEAVYNSVFAKIYEVHEKFNEIAENFYYNDELPSQLEAAVNGVGQVKSIYERFKPQLKDIVGMYFDSQLYEDLVNEVLGDKDTTKALVEVLTGREDETFTVDSMFDNFFDNEETVKAYIKGLVDSGDIDNIADMIKNLAGLSEENVENFVDGLETFAEEGIEPYRVKSTYVTTIDEYKVVIGGYALVLKRAFAM